VVEVLSGLDARSKVVGQIDGTTEGWQRVAGFRQVGSPRAVD
jgi:hypothetical protein